MEKRQRILDRLREVMDPELGVNVVDLGLIYDVDCTEKSVEVLMALTSPTCPLGPLMVRQVEEAIRRELPDVDAVDVQLVSEPPWSPERMTPAAKAQLGW